MAGFDPLYGVDTDLAALRPLPRYQNLLEVIQ
jgi:hypothetical protein